MSTKEGIMGGKEGSFAKGKGYEGMMGGKEGYEGMKGRKEGYEGMRVAGYKGGRGYDGKKGKMGGGSDWLLKRGIWEKQVIRNRNSIHHPPAEAGHGCDGGEGGDGVGGVQHQRAATAQPGQC